MSSMGRKEGVRVGEVPVPPVPPPVAAAAAVVKAWVAVDDV